MTFSSLTLPIMAQVEICDNAIDDDGDGLIDLNDEDCFCRTSEAISLIPNPSFEDQTCCPNGRSQMNCADTWIQASGPTTDYIHTCGWMGWENLPMPLPIPDGQGAVGFRNGRFARANPNNNGLGVGTGNNNNGNGGTNANFKEYAGACLISPLRKGVSYKFQFYIGFTIQPHSPPISITFFGTEDCDNLPFGDGDDQFGCPTNGDGWMRLGATSAFGTSEWRQLEINVVPTTDIYAITIGPPCNQINATANPYYFFDNLVLAEQSAFEFDIRANNQLCANNLSFEIPEYDSLTYQWYKDGIALEGATFARLDLPPGEGMYQVVFTSEEGCTTTRPFNYSIPAFTTARQEVICENQSYDFDNQQLTQTGIYYDTLKTADNCDSIIRLDLRVNSNLEVAVAAKIFPSETFKIGNFSFGQPGQFQQTIPSSFGCDSTVNLTLDYYKIFTPNIFSPNGDGLNDYFTISGNSDLEQINNFVIFDRWGNQVFRQAALSTTQINTGWNGQFDGNIVPEGVYVYTAQVMMNDGIERTISGMVTLIR